MRVNLLKYLYQSTILLVHFTKIKPYTIPLIRTLLDSVIRSFSFWWWSLLRPHLPIFPQIVSDTCELFTSYVRSCQLISGCHLMLSASLRVSCSAGVTDAQRMFHKLRRNLFFSKNIPNLYKSTQILCLHLSVQFLDETGKLQKLHA